MQQLWNFEKILNYNRVSGGFVCLLLLYSTPAAKTLTSEKEKLRRLLGKKEKMEVAQLQRCLVDLTSSLFSEGFLDDQFTQLQMLQDESNPDFVFEVVTLFFDDSERLLNELTKVLELQPVDFKKVDAHVHQLKGSSSRSGVWITSFDVVYAYLDHDEEIVAQMFEMPSASQTGVLPGEEQAGNFIQGKEISLSLYLPLISKDT
ncbi:peroxiredoxin type-2 [Asimina triloba]